MFPERFYGIVKGRLLYGRILIKEEAHGKRPAPAVRKKRMSEECTHDCSSCGAACSSRDAAPKHDAPNPNSSVKKVIGVVSGKGGVGKSMTSALLACAMARRGYHCGILDADITGPSIPKLFGIHGRAMADDKGCWPIQSRMGIDVMSINLLVENEEDPVDRRCCQAVLDRCGLEGRGLSVRGHASGNR